MGLKTMSTEKEQVVDSLLKSREELTQSVYDIINAWMLTSDAKLDPDFALGIMKIGRASCRERVSRHV